MSGHQVDVRKICASATVLPGLELQVLGMRYWAPELSKYRGWEVLVEIEPDDTYAEVWTKGRTQLLCIVACIGKAGYESMEDQRAAARADRERRASVVRWQIAELLNVFDQRIERARQRAEASNAAARHGRVGNVVGLLRRAWNFLVNDSEVGRDEPAQGVDMDLDRIEAILKHGDTLFGGHGVAPAMADGADANPADAAAHRLSGDAK